METVKKWGFAVNKDRGINLDANDYRFARRLIEREPSVLLCIGCGGCTATCTAGNLTPFNFRRLHLMIRRGEYGDIGRETAKCMLCGKCRLVCPRGVNTRNIVIAIRSLL